MGLVKSSDTGQIDWNTVVKPASQFIIGYEIFRFNDVLAATKPVYLKIRYEVVGSPGNRMWFRFSAGTGTDGFGNLTGFVTAEGQYSNAVKTAGAILPSYCSGSPSSLFLATYYDTAAANSTQMILIERLKLIDGTETDLGFAVWFKSGNSLSALISYAVGASGSSHNAFSLSDCGFSKVGDDIAMSPAFSCLGEVYYSSCFVYYQPDRPALVPFDDAPLGVEHTFMPLGTGVTGAICQGTTTNHGLVIPWE